MLKKNRMINYYKVAEQVFCLQLPDDSSLLPLLGQYEPFRVDGGQALFTLSLADELPEPSEKKVLYKSPREKGEPLIDLYGLPDGKWYFEMSPVCGMPVCGWMEADKDLKTARLRMGECRDRIFAINNSLMLMFAFCTTGRGILEMHASVIKYQGKGYLFLGKSGTGKSTHSRQWLKAIEGTSLLNDDNPIVRVDEEGKVIVYGSPWSGKTPCYINDSVPVGAFVRIRQCPENKIHKMEIIEAYAAIYSSSSGYKADLGMSDGLHSTMEKIVLSVPCYLLDCLPDEDAARVCAKEVVK